MQFFLYNYNYDLGLPNLY